MQNEQAIAMLDGFPVSKGHVLVIPKQHVASFFEISLAEQSALLDLITQAKRIIDAEHQPDAYNIGINDGSDAGQTVAHLHVHLIPRYHNDVADPRGGVRWIMPDKAVYWDED
jgi:diadenosine tetraphosphate (Ap4A) HIT family hydrolase